MSDIQKQSVRIGVVITALLATAVFTWRVSAFANSIDKRLMRIELKLGLSDVTAQRE